MDSEMMIILTIIQVLLVQWIEELQVFSLS
jgi:hypothetical protein